MDGLEIVVVAHWQKCTECLRDELSSQEFNTWIRPLRAEHASDSVHLYAPNRFILDWVKSKFHRRIEEILKDLTGQDVEVALHVAHRDYQSNTAQSAPVKESTQDRAESKQAVSNGAGIPEATGSRSVPADVKPVIQRVVTEGTNAGAVDTIIEGKLRHRGALNTDNNFDNFVIGKSNQLARAAAMQVAENPDMPITRYLSMGE